MYLRALIRSSLLPLLAVAACAEELPAGYEIGEESRSPDGRLAVLYPRRSEALEAEYPPNLLVRLQPYAVLSKVGSTGLPQGVTTELNVTWSGNEIVAISETRKWGLLRLWVYELADGKVKRVHPIGEAARRFFTQDLRKRLLKKYPKEQEYFAWLSGTNREPQAPDFQIRGRQVFIDLVADNKLNLASGPHWTAQLRAVWNLDTGKFEQVNFRPGRVTVRGEP